MFERGTLWERIRRTTEEALRAGAIEPIATDFELIEDAGIQFLVRIATRLALKDQARRGRSSDEPFDPFLPYEPAMYVADASPSHVCLLNRFNVLDHHLLIVTRQFEPQEAPLDVGDFTALWNCMSEYDALGFYNAGSLAGASQSHKHLQMVPLPLAPAGEPIPIEPLLEEAIFHGEIGRVSRFRFPNAIVRLDPQIHERPDEAVRLSQMLYRAMMQSLGLRPDAAATRPYNLLVTRRWMLLVPRTREKFQSISLNALTFAGALLVGSQQQLDVLKQHGPMAALEHVAT